MKKYTLVIVGFTLIIASAFSFTTILGSDSTPENINNNNDSPSVKWVTVEEAQELGKKAPKKVFIDVYTSWCGWCKVMDKNTFSDPAVAEYANKNYYAIKLNAESNKEINFNGQKLTEKELAQGLKVTGYPTIVFMDETFQQFQPVSGYRKPDEFISMLKQFNGEGQ